MTRKRKVNWKKIEESTFSIGIGLIIVYAGPLNLLMDILGGIFIVPGVAYLFAQPEVRINLKLFINWVSRKQVFKDVSISSSNVASNLTADRGGIIQIQQGTLNPKTPYLRVIPKLNYFGMRTIGGGAGGDFDSYQFMVEITNIGDGIATDIHGHADLIGSVPPLELRKGGQFSLHDLGPSESNTIDFGSATGQQVDAQKMYRVFVTYKNQAGQEQPLVKEEGLVADLKRS